MAIFGDRWQIRSLSNNGLGRSVDIINFRYRDNNGLPLLLRCLFVLSVFGLERKCRDDEGPLCRRCWCKGLDLMLRLLWLLWVL